MKNIRFRTSALAVASCLALSGLPLAAHAAGLGKVTVFSALGQPLRAEVELSATREELAGMKAQLASPDAFKQAGLDYATTLTGIRFSIDKSASGQPIVKLSSDKPINDPFVDMLLELNWPSGRLVREYTFLLDPPELAVKAAPPMSPVLSRPAAETSAPARAEKPEAARPRVQESAARPAEPAEGREVKRGDTLNKIASELKPEGVSLEQMLVGLLRANQDAFDGGNMNRLRTGKILSVPEPSALEAVSEGEARKIVIAQSADWNAYRRKLAGIAAQASAKEDAAKQESAGRIAAKVEDKAAVAAEAKDQVRISKADAAAGKAGAAAKSGEEDLVAKEKALKDAGDRLASLEKNVVELQKLIDLKSRNLAELQKQAGSKEAAPAEAAKPEAAKPAPQAAVAPALAEKAAEKPVEPAPAEPVAAKPEEAKPEPKPEPKPDEMPQPKPQPAPPPPPPFEEPGLVSRLLDDPSSLQDAAASILALLGGLFLYKRRRQREAEKKAALIHPPAAQDDAAADNAVFGSVAGQSVDTSSLSVEHADFSQAGPGSIDTAEVDPVAEADVYIAYGRDTQAEEILLEAKQKDPRRYAIHLKLLEIYANRKNPKAFELLAAELYNELGGVGAEWEKAAAMGLLLDPTNPLYGGAAEPAVEPAPFDADATMIMPAQSVESVIPEPEPETFAAPDDLADLAPVSAALEAAVPELAAPSELMSLDFDLGPSDAHAASPAAERQEEVGSEPVLPEAAVDAGALDFDFDLGVAPEPLAEAPQEAPLQAPAEVVEPTELSDMAAFDLDFELPEIAAEPAAPVAPAPAVAAPADDIDFGFDINFDEAPAPVAEPEPPVEEVSVEEVSADLADLAPADGGALEFDIDLPDLPDSVDSVDSVDLRPPAPQPAFDMSAISLDLADELPPVSQPEAAVPDELPPPAFEASLEDDFRIDDLPVTAEAVDASLPFASDLDADFGASLEPAPTVDAALREEVATKLDLAKAYEEMGDLEGARELLLEVLIEGDAAQQEKAQVILDKIGG